MANVTQYYTPNQKFQISSVSQLNDASNNEYTWAGRTLTAWYDSETKEIHKISSDQEISVVFSGMTANLSGLWDLDRISSYLSVISNDNDTLGTCGIVCITSDTTDDTSRYYPLSSRELCTFNVSNGQTSCIIPFQSDISVKLSAVDDTYIPTKFIIKFYEKYKNYSPTLTSIIFDSPTETFIWAKGGQEHSIIGTLSVIAEFNKGVMTYYSGKNQPNPYLQ